MNTVQPINVAAVEQFKRGEITEAEMWRVLNANIKIDYEPDHEAHSPRVKEQVYDINRKGKSQPNGYIYEVESYGPYGMVVVHYYDEPQETDVLVHTQDMDWHSEHKRWYVRPVRKTGFRDRLILYKARKAGILK